jgi:hypothetical protein
VTWSVSKENALSDFWRMEDRLLQDETTKRKERNNTEICLSD